jgi:hypothetical protein
LSASDAGLRALELGQGGVRAVEALRHAAVVAAPEQAFCVSFLAFLQVQPGKQGAADGVRGLREDAVAVVVVARQRT